MSDSSSITIDDIFDAYQQILLDGFVPDQMFGTIEHTYKAWDEPGGVADSATGLSLMWMDERPDGSIDPSKLYVTVNESVNPVFVVESDTAIRVRMVRVMHEPRAKANTSFWYIAGDDTKSPEDPKVLKFYDQASAVRVLVQLRAEFPETTRNHHVAEHQVEQ